MKIPRRTHLNIPIHPMSRLRVPQRIRGPRSQENAGTHKDLPIMFASPDASIDFSFTTYGTDSSGSGSGSS